MSNIDDVATRQTCPLPVAVYTSEPHNSEPSHDENILSTREFTAKISYQPQIMEAESRM